MKLSNKIARSIPQAQIPMEAISTYGWDQAACCPDRTSCRLGILLLQRTPARYRRRYRQHPYIRPKRWISCQILCHKENTHLKRMVQPQPMPDLMHRRPPLIVVLHRPSRECGVSDHDTVFERLAEV